MIKIMDSVQRHRVSKKRIPPYFMLIVLSYVTVFHRLLGSCLIRRQVLLQLDNVLWQIHLGKPNIYSVHVI